LGSIIEVFPGKRGAGRRQQRAAAAWRSAPLPGSGAVRVRAAKLEDFAAIRALQRLSQPGMPEWTLKQFESHRSAFPEGQLVAVTDGDVVGAASSLVVQWDEYALDHTWKSVTGDGFFTTHDTAGRTLYGTDVVVDISRRGAGIARALYQAQRRLCRKLNLRRIISAARLAGYHAASAEMTPETYAQRVIWGDIEDANLRLPMSQGFQFCGIIRDYLPEDVESEGNAALVVWLNPLYSPTEPPANVETERPRKCA
jgi:ribosomal protein S18 acetylase RimI-like enzyme